MDTLKGAAFMIAGSVLALSDPALRFTPAFRKKDEAIEKGLVVAWGLGLLAIVFFFIRNSLDIPVETIVSGGESLVGRLRQVLLILFVFAYAGSVLYRLALGMGANAVRRNQPLNNHRRQYLRQTVLSVLAAFPLFALVNYVSAVRNPTLDLTPGYYSFSDDARTIIKSLDKEVQGYVFLPDQQAVHESGKRTKVPELFRIAEDVRVMLEQLPLINSKIKLTFLNADLDADRMADFKSASNGSIIFRVLKSGDVDPDAKPYLERRAYVYREKDIVKLEREVTRALIQVSSPHKNLYFTASNGERYAMTDPSMANGSVATFTEEIQFYNFFPKALKHSSGWPGPIPADAGALVILGPTVPFGPEARKAINDYIANKGRVFIAIDPDGQEHFDWLLSSSKKRQFRFKKAFLSNLPKLPGTIVTDNVVGHRITENVSIAGSRLIAMPKSGHFEEVKNSPKPKEETPAEMTPLKDVEPFVFLYSTYNTVIDENRNGKKDGAEKSGRLPLALVYADEKNPDATKVAVYSSVDWLSNSGLRFPLDQRNIILGADTLFWLTESKIAAAMKIKERKTRNVQVTDDLKFRNLVLGMLLFPALIGMSLGAGVYLYRRKRKALGEE